MGFFELWIGYVSRLTTDSSLTFSDGMYVTRQQLEVMYDSEFVSTLINFTSAFNSLALNDTEIGLFSAVVLYKMSNISLLPTPTSEFVSTLINFTSAFNSLALNDTEIGLFSAVVLFTENHYLHTFIDR
ncbi:ecdysone-induced protein 78C-like [Diaphorina citri]|uniref:Ecdysone-induced protein 78C-like n=1 Tax=Diaphorina citri TaxID=121845 RepID=A0A1S3DDE4_DIACI|nr:ecdysone-induced protein 78C-like [Diaphorina citri]